MGGLRLRLHFKLQAIPPEIVQGYAFALFPNHVQQSALEVIGKSKVKTGQSLWCAVPINQNSRRNPEHVLGPLRLKPLGMQGSALDIRPSDKIRDLSMWIRQQPFSSGDSSYTRTWLYNMLLDYHGSISHLPWLKCVV